ncbi:MAG: hypothetical protein FJ286_15045 [Planctomycetes bacterium]|nr:hypothetical protein [Planctomycetota bacterium]
MPSSLFGVGAIGSNVRVRPAWLESYHISPWIRMGTASGFPFGVSNVPLNGAMRKHSLVVF